MCILQLNIIFIALSISRFIINPPGEAEKSNGGRFGSSLACLGQTDISSLRKMVVVGAPYYDENGAVFVYRYNKQKSK